MSVSAVSFLARRYLRAKRSFVSVITVISGGRDTRLKTAADVTAAAGRLRGSYTYDAQGRRIHRLVEVYHGGTWTLQSQMR